MDWEFANSIPKVKMCKCVNFNKCKLMLAIVFTCIFSLNSIAQNLVMNGGFEAPTNTSMFGTYVVKSRYVKVGQGSQFSESDASLYQQRAKTISDYLIAKGINSTLLFTQSLGSTDAFDKDNLGLNRRVEIIVE